MSKTGKRNQSLGYLFWGISLFFIKRIPSNVFIAHCAWIFEQLSLVVKSGKRGDEPREFGFIAAVDLSSHQPMSSFSKSGRQASDFWHSL